MKTRVILVITLLCLSLGLFSEIVRMQDFESSPQDNWGYSPNPQPNRLVWWGPSDQPIGGVTAQSGDWYWASWDLDNINHSLVFDESSCELGFLYSISFWYFTKNLNPDTDYCRYALSYDGGITWETAVNLDGDTDAWSLAEVDIPHYANSVMLKVEALYDGFSKYVHWDNFVLERVELYPVAPTVYNVEASQRRDGSKIIDIHYNLFDANNDPSSISVFVSLDGGESYEYQPATENLSGDIGDEIPSGTTGNIVWHAGEEDIEFDSDNCCIIIKAEDNTTGAVATPVFDPPSQYFVESQIVSIFCATEGASIYYTTDGTDPDESSLPYTNPITISTTTTLKARAYKEQWLPSAIAQGEYVIVPEGFVYVPGGTFTMGDTRGAGGSSELPTHSVTLNPFYLSKYQVTQGEYETIMGSNPAHDCGVGSNYPVYYVSWYSSLKYCNLRSLAEGFTPVYSINGSTNPASWGSVPTSSNSTWNAAICDWNANGYRLPTEAEWEYAARGASNNPDYLYSGSDDIDAVAWYSGNSDGSTHPVGGKAPNGLGIYDMSGNLYEWCWDWYGSSYYGSSPSNNPTGPTSGSSRVKRGGYWNSSACYCRVAYRGGYDPPSNASNSYGFRVCRAGL